MREKRLNRKIGTFDNAENGLGLQRRTIESLLNFPRETGVESVGIQLLDDFAVAIANSQL